MITTKEFDRAVTLDGDERDEYLKYLGTLSLEDQEDFVKRFRAHTDELRAKNEANLLEFAAMNEEIAKMNAETAETQRQTELMESAQRERQREWQREQNNRKTIYKAIGIFVVCLVALWFFFKASPEELAAKAAKEAESKAFYDDYEAKRTAKAADEESAKINNSIRYKFILQTDLEASQGSKLSEQQNTELIRRAQEACGLYDPSIPSADGCK